MEVLLAELARVGSIFVLSFFSFWTAIPAGLALGLGPLAVIVTTSASYATGVALVTLVGSRARTWFERRLLRGRPPAADGRLGGLWRRYGLWGLALAAPMTTGAQLGALLGLTLNLKPRRLFVGMTLGAVLWSSVLTGAVRLGVAGIQQVLPAPTTSDVEQAPAPGASPTEAAASPGAD